jgi:large subunit ribosomal protein L1
VEKLSDNVKTLIDSIVRLKPSAAKGVYLKGISISTTMGPGLKLDPQEIRNLMK